MSLLFQSLSRRSITHSWIGAILWAMIALGLASCNSTTPTSALPTSTSTATAIASVPVPQVNTQTSSANALTLTPTSTLPAKPATSTGTLQPAPSPTVSGTPVVLLSAPQLNQPLDRAAFPSGSSVILMWTWQRSLSADEYFEIQLSKLDTELKDWACSITPSFEIIQAPYGDGWYQWRVVVRRGKIDGQQCIASQDLTMPSETRTFVWGSATQPPSPESTPSATNVPAPTATQAPPTPTRFPQPPPTPTKRPYP